MEKPIVLIVDDEAVNLSILSRLPSPSYLVHACRSGEQALHYNANTAQTPDLILLDVMMPGMDGYAVLSCLQKNEKSQDIPVLFVTALGEIQNEEYGLQMGAVDYLTKPLKPVLVLSRVRTHLEIKRSRGRLKSQKDQLEAEVARYMREILTTQDDCLGALAQLAETRDSNAGRHIERTQAYVEILARRLQSHHRFASDLEDLALSRILKAIPLHDIGIIGVPDSILLKRGKLGSEEWETMKTHCLAGANTIGNAIDRMERSAVSSLGRNKPEFLRFLETAKEIALHHHERWDGTGYPDGLSKLAPPLPARLMSLADVYDALTNPQIYRDAWSTEDAADYIRRQRGLHFDPDIVDAFDAEWTTFQNMYGMLSDCTDINSL